MVEGGERRAELAPGFCQSLETTPAEPETEYVAMDDPMLPRERSSSNQSQADRLSKIMSTPAATVAPTTNFESLDYEYTENLISQIATDAIDFKTYGKQRALKRW